MIIYQCPLSTANYHVMLWHRHSGPVRGHKLSLAAYKGTMLVGVAIVGRPVARALDDGATLEVTRVATDGTRNACSALYAEAKRRCKAMGCGLITYTLASESGASLRAIGAIPTLLKPRKDNGWQSRANRATHCVAGVRWRLL